MRSLALARYRFLVSIRASGAAVSGVVAAAVAALLGGSRALVTAALPADRFTEWAPEAFEVSSQWIGPAYLLHVAALMAVSFVFGTAQRRSDQPAADLMETAPVTAAELFWGDCLGVLAATLTIHAAVVPLLAFLLAIAPNPSTTFWFFEALVVVVLFLVSALSAWSLRAESWRWSISRSFRASMIVAIIIAGAAGLFARRPAGLWDVVTDVVTNPGRQSLAALLHAFRNPPTATVAFAILYVAFVAFFFIHSVRRALRE